MKISAMDLEDQFLILESHHRFKPTVRKMASFELWCWYMPSQELQKQSKTVHLLLHKQFGLWGIVVYPAC
jgi:DUF1365 family protein